MPDLTKSPMWEDIKRELINIARKVYPNLKDENVNFEANDDMILVFDGQQLIGEVHYAGKANGKDEFDGKFRKNLN